MLLQGEGREELPRPRRQGWASLRPRPECKEAHASGGESGRVSGQHLRPLLFTAGLQEAPVIELGAGATVALPVPARDALTQHWHLVHPYPSSDQAAPLRVGFN